MKIKNSVPDKTFNVSNYIFMILFTLFVFYPFYWCVMLSFNDGMDSMRGGIYLWPRIPTLDNFRVVFRTADILMAARMSVLRTVVGIITALAVTSMAGYAMSKKNLKLRKFYMTLMLITMFFGGGLIPYILIIRALGLMNSFWVYIFPNMFSVFHMIIFMTFFRTIPDSLEESAKIDGANDLFIFFRIIVPLSKPVFATIALFVGVGQWNSWFDVIIFAPTVPELNTLARVLTQTVNAQAFAEAGAGMLGVAGMGVGVTSVSVLLATMVVTAFPIIALYPFLQKYFVKGVMIGSVKE